MKDAPKVFRALADPTRRQILQLLKDGELSAGEIGSHFAMAAPSLSRHLGILSEAGLVRSRRQANHIFYALEPERLALCLSEFMSAVCPADLVLHRRLSGRDRMPDAGEEPG
jgi:DNA-binding transcriptional ArsR family regulator